MQVTTAETEKWICKKCGSERKDKPYKNEVCKTAGCKGRFIHKRRCKCGEWFVIDKGDRKYCSDACAGIKRKNPRRGKVEASCAYCGKPMQIYASAVRKRNYCNKKCRDKQYAEARENRTCLQCGKTFTVLTSVIEKSNASGHFCSTACYWESMRKPQAKYQGFRKAKRQFFTGTQFCAICGTTKNIQIHHIIPNRLTQDQRKENLIPLCPLHHNRIERFTEKIHRLFAGRYEEELWYLNNIFRTRQIETAMVIWGAKNGRFED